MPSRSTSKRKVRDTLYLAEFDFIFIDESQRIKNYLTQISKACAKLNSTVRIVLSSTPIFLDKTSEIYAYAEYLNLKLPKVKNMRDFSK